MKRILRAVITSLLLIIASAAGPAASSQQPDEQGPPPDSCAQAVRENTAYRERIASLERQIDATQEEAKTYYLRAATWHDAYLSAMRLADSHRLDAAALRSDLEAAHAEARELRTRLRRRR